ncbi:MAG TPA: hypothetical protein VFY67_16500 [Pyrinomonadaceae bacterium]|nr:hypothetical protein [Pyrinomonadaceae bacterium]
MNKEQEAINDGQRKINGALCYVDWHVIEALDALIKALTNKNILCRQDLEKISKPFKEAYYTSGKVAGIEPPGCNPNFFSEDMQDARAA